MTMPPPERLPPLPTATATPTPTAPGSLMTPAQQTVAPPAVPSPPGIPAKLRAGEMAVPEQPPDKLSKWEFFAAKHQMPSQENAFGVYLELSAGERKAFDAEWEEYFYGIAPEGEGVAPPLLSQGEERMMIDLQNAIKIGEMDEGQAWKVIENYWSKEQTQTRRAEDATRRGETLLAGAHAGPNLPMTGPGGMGAGLQQKYGLPDLTPGVQGLPGPQALGVFGQAQEQLGLPSQLPSLEAPQFQLPNWQAMGQAMPNFGGTNYFDKLLQQGRMTAPGL